MRPHRSAPPPVRLARTRGGHDGDAAHRAAPHGRDRRPRPGLGRLRAGAEAFDLICRAVPVYAPLRLLLRVPRFRAAIERELSGCADGACEVAPSAPAGAEATPRTVPRGVA